VRRHRDFRLLLAAQGVSLFGSQITAVAVPFQMYRLTGSTLAVGLIGLAEILPVLVLAFVGGALADAVDRRRMLLLTELGTAAVSGGLVANALLRAPQVAVLFLAASLSAALYALKRPSLDSLLPRLVDPDEIVPAAAVNSLVGTAGTIVGPGLGGVLIAATGLPFTYTVDVCTFAVSLAMLYLMRSVPPPPDAPAPSLGSIAEGFRYAWGRPDLLGTYLVDMAAMFFGMPIALFPAIATRFGGASVLGLLYAAPSVGSLLVAATSGWTRRIYRHGRAIVLAATAWGAAIVGFGLSPALAPALFFLAVAGAGDEVSGMFRSAIWNQTIPNSIRGRLAGIEMISWSTGPAFGDLEAGTVAAAFGVRASILSGGILCVLSSAVLAMALPSLWGYDVRLSGSGTDGQTATAREGARKL
jgi:MFS family permease